VLQVFKILWTEPKGAGSSKRTEIVPLPMAYGESFYSSIRRFVIIQPVRGHCLCLYVISLLYVETGPILIFKRPILTYRGQGTSKHGANAQDHAIIYTEVKGKKDQRVTELPHEKKLTKTPIRVEPRTPRDLLDPASRLNYAKIYTIEYNVKVCFIGKIHEESMKYFVRDYNLAHQPLPQEESYESD